MAAHTDSIIAAMDHSTHAQAVNEKRPPPKSFKNLLTLQDSLRRTFEPAYLDSRCYCNWIKGQTGSHYKSRQHFDGKTTEQDSGLWRYGRIEILRPEILCRMQGEVVNGPSLFTNMLITGVEDCLAAPCRLCRRPMAHDFA